MRIIISGYGTMGKLVKELALEKNIEIIGIFSLNDIENIPYPLFKNAEKLPKADAIIDFSHPDVTEKLLQAASIHQTPLVIATTGAREKLKNLMQQASKEVPIFFSANMSYGIYVLTEALKFLTPLLAKDYDIEILEKHHNKKIDAPSGTAIKLLEAIQEIDPEYFPIYDRSQAEHKRSKKEIGISSLRAGSIVGEHELIFASDDEVIEITHKAQSKKIFADGALKAAEKITNKKAGLYTFNTL